MKRSLAALVAALVLLDRLRRRRRPTERASERRHADHGRRRRPAPSAIVSMSATSTEMLFAIGAGDQVVAVDDQSNYPGGRPDHRPVGLRAERRGDHAPTTPTSSCSSDAGELEAGLEQIGIEVLVAPAAVDARRHLRPARGARRGRRATPTRRPRSSTTMQADIEELVATVPERDEPLTYYHELDDTLYSVTSDTFIGAALRLAGAGERRRPGRCRRPVRRLPAAVGRVPRATPTPTSCSSPTRSAASRTPRPSAARPGFAGMTAVDERPGRRPRRRHRQPLGPARRRPPRARSSRPSQAVPAA